MSGRSACSLLLAAALLSLPAAYPARAQEPKNILLGVDYGNSGPSQVNMALNFSQARPQYAIMRNDSADVSIAFAGAVRGNGAAVRDAVNAVVSGVSFDQQGPILSVTFHGRSPIHLTAAALSDRIVLLSLSPLAAPDRPVADRAGAVTPHPAGDSAAQFLVVPLKYADVSEVVGLLTAEKAFRPNDFFSPQEPAFGSVGTNGAYVANAPLGATGSAPPADLSLGQTVDDAIGVDRRLNAIILRGAPDLVQRLKGQIEAIDRPVGSVVLETVFVELTQSGAQNLGFDFTNSSGQIATGVFQTGPFSSGGGGSTSAGLSLQARLAAEVAKGDGRIVSKPRISAQSGSTAKIVTGNAIPILTAITLSGVNGVSQQVQYVNVGVTLQIAPRVTADGNVSSHVFCVVSSVTGTSQGYPTISQREASTSATVHDGESFVIGGLSEETRLGNDSKVPGLGDIPVIGTLAHAKTMSTTKTDLYIVVTPHIVQGKPAGQGALVE